MKSVLTIVAAAGLALLAGCAVTPPASPPPAPAAVPTCPAPAPPEAAAAAPPATPRPAYVRPVVPPLPAELYAPPAPRTVAPKPVSYAADVVAAMVAGVSDADVFVAGGDTYFWHKDPHGRRERVFYGHGDRRHDIAQRRAAALSHVAEVLKNKSDK